MNKKIIIFCAVLICMAAAFYFYKRAEQPPAVSYAVVKAQKGTIHEIVDTTGEVAALDRVEIKPTTAGRIETLLVDEGAAVKKGQILAYLSSTDRAAILDAARASKEDIKAWENTYKPTPVISPMDGIIILKAVVEGQTVAATDVVYALSDQLIVVANVDEADIGKIKTGQKAAVQLDAYQDVYSDGKVFQILEEGINTNNVITYNVKIKMDNLPSFYKSMMSANIDVTVNTFDNAIIVPYLAVGEDEDGNAYVLAGSNKKQIRKTVKTGVQDGDKIQILSGLNEGDEILVKAENYAPAQPNNSKSFMLQMNRKNMSNTDIINSGK
ncbi:MAG: efflux RND transporter periplasmic adaptor subunit [Elusimicrobia bacterium]|nr:efflux RND transporter periplasmic adaptor subunit [Elusimicrobiota bacterium]